MNRAATFTAYLSLAQSRARCTTANDKHQRHIALPGPVCGVRRDSETHRLARISSVDVHLDLLQKIGGVPLPLLDDVLARHRHLSDVDSFWPCGWISSSAVVFRIDITPLLLLEQLPLRILVERPHLGPVIDRDLFLVHRAHPMIF